MIEPSRAPERVPNGTIATISPIPDRWLLVVRGLAQVIVEDQQGLYVGPSRDPDYPNGVENQIPGASYKPGQVFSSVFLDQPGIYTFTLKGHAPNKAHIYLNLYNGSGKFQTFFFYGVPMTERSQARLVYDTADWFAIPVIALDLEGNGEIEQIRPVILSPQASDDVIPPTTQIDVDGNVVTISATDNPGGAGVWRTYYTTEGTTRVTYTKPFHLPPDAKLVMAYSEDQVGNLEYPGAVRPILGISETHLLTKVEAGTKEPVPYYIDILNLDPISISGQLEWTASTDVTWLSVEPSGGTTPHQLKLLVDSAGLGAGAHQGRVIVRSLTPGTLFAERMLYVHIEIAADPEAQGEQESRSNMPNQETDQNPELGPTDK